MASYRHLARIAVMQTLFAYEFRNFEVEPDLESNCSEYADKLKDTSFAYELLNGIIENREAILNKISKEAPEWPIDRIAPIDRAILEMGAYEILYSQDVPPVVAINEAIEIAKVFGDTNSSKFVNGVLSSIMKSKNDQGKVSKPAKKTKN
ncbi:transcription antitermination factor NusB [Candidatus Peregrinibacteria bacterium]|nr:transcription antitermination factor NusB [Candidatus Peregrinibacteria bacterium]